MLELCMVKVELAMFAENNKKNAKLHEVHSDVYIKLL